MTSSSSTTHHLFDRPELLDNQTRLILSADAKPKRLNRSATRSAGIPGILERSDSVASGLIIQETDDDDVDENVELNNEDFYMSRKGSMLQNDSNYDTDIEQEQEPTKDYSCQGLYLEQCRRHGVIPSTHFLRHLNNETLTIRYCGLKPINIKVMVPSLKVNTRITKLDLRDNGLGSRGAVYISQLLQENEYIVELDLSNNDIGLQGCKALCRVLRSNRTIRTLNMEGNRFNDDCAPHFAEVLTQNEYLTHINLNKNLFENESSGRLLGQSLGENQTIEEFYFGWNHLRSKACGFFIKPLASNARLSILDLSWNGCGLLAAKAIFELLRKNTTLEKLYLDHNQFNTECAAYIGKGLAKNETLKILTLQGNPLESSGCYAVLRPLLKQPTSQLQVIDLRGIIVNKDFVDLVTELSPILPQLKIKLGREKENELIE
ncbi:unnamed protein product [Rotaria magnacalcarata]|uniref:Uncharacterized protein n=4 Tax=Rotaria magnacalcarata TaxID=392030 RepID=A0A815Z8U7_9BILA|nr:unnamed protein product [Rotaria magnacalcarata]CAF1579645.1 unnamed protein product [Rotaria magnacalcarata]CAF1949382.1 unnamed protein product [Rotaria magnacalcarata]CAF2084303.1 unnamed protein product [Rotaria magnacalcarata]CAF2223777.1 unnamed protein product [Rotaria magnacalcarata]